MSSRFPIACGKQLDGGKLLRGKVLPRSTPVQPIATGWHREAPQGTPSAESCTSISAKSAPIFPCPLEPQPRCSPSYKCSLDVQSPQVDEPSAGGGLPTSIQTAKPAQRTKNQRFGSLFLPQGQKLSPQASQLPAKNSGKNRGVPLAGQDKAEVKLLLRIHYSQEKAYKQSHRHRVQSGSHHPVGKVDGKRLGIEQVAKKIGVKIDQALAGFAAQYCAIRVNSVIQAPMAPSTANPCQPQAAVPPKGPGPR